MHGDWIKMRIWLRRDPKVIRMAEYLATDRDFRFWAVQGTANEDPPESVHMRVTRNVTRALCVTALLEIWGVARDQGYRNKDDLVVDFCDFVTLDEIAGTPSLGAAMAEVGWAKESPGRRVCFPNFFLDKQPPSERHKSTNAERQSRHREKKRNASNVTPPVTSNVTPPVTSNVTKTPRRGEESKEEENEESLSQSPPPSGTEREKKLPDGGMVLSPQGDTLGEIRAGKRSMPCDYPQHAATADRIIEHYKATVQDGRLTGNARETIISLLESGLSERELCMCATGYAHHCNAHGHDKRLACSSFYGTRLAYKEFLGWTAPPAGTSPPRPQANGKPRQETIREKLKRLNGEPA